MRRSWSSVTEPRRSIRKCRRSPSGTRASCRSATRGRGRPTTSSPFACSSNDQPSSEGAWVLFKLLGAPLGLPLAGVKFVFRQLADLADQELNDEGALREHVVLLQVQRGEGG